MLMMKRHFFHLPNIPEPCMSIASLLTTRSLPALAGV